MYEGTSRATAVAVVTATGWPSGFVPAFAAPPLLPFDVSPPPAASAFDSERPHDAPKSEAASTHAASTTRDVRESSKKDIDRPIPASFRRRRATEAGYTRSARVRLKPRSRPALR